MKEIFEQFQFIPRMFNTSSVEVQDTGIFSIIWSAIIWFFMQVFHITVNIIGVSVLFSIVLFIVMVSDFITGIQASKKEFREANPGKKFEGESKKGLRWVIKYMVYVTGFFILNVMVKEVSALDIEELEKFMKMNLAGLIVGIFKIIKLFLMLYILRWELKSIDENFERLGYSFKIFSFFDNFIHSISTIFKSKTGVDLDKKD